MRNSIIYHAFFVDDVETLKIMFPPVHINQFYHHSTIAFRPKNADNIHVGRKCTLEIIGRLTTEKVDVLLVKRQSHNLRFSHITLSTADGVKPVESQTELQDNIEDIVDAFGYIPVTEGYFNGNVVTN